jgi:hypothetical protein
LKKASGRQHENTTAKNVEKVEKVNEKQNQIDSQMKDTELYNAGTAKTEHADLLGFQGGVDEEYIEFGDERRRGRGGRGGMRGSRGGMRGSRGGMRGGERGGERQPRTGGRGGKMVFNEEAFPTL